MGSDDNITESTFEHLAEHLGKSILETRLLVFHILEEKKASKNPSVNPEIAELFTKAAKSWGQSVEEAEKNTHRLLQKQLQ